MINLEIINQNEEVESIINLNQVVSKPLEKLQFSKFTDDTSVVLDYFESTELNSEEHLELNSLSWKAAQNNEAFFEDLREGKTTSNIINSFYRDLYITNIVLKNTKENIEKPLWYKHKRRNIKEVNFHVLNKGSLLEIEEGFVLKNGYAYTNYKNIFDDASSNYRMYFVSGITEDGSAFNELLNVEEAIGKTSFEDISLEDGSIIRDSYEVLEENGRFSFRINSPNKVCEDEERSSYIYYKAKEDNLIRLLKPEVYKMNNPWLMRVTNGNFLKDGKRYWVPEFKNQPFDGQFGTLRLVNKECTYVTESIIKLPVDKIMVAPEQLVHIDMRVLDESENVIFALTTDTNKIGSKYSNTSVTYQTGIKSWDEESGFIELDKSMNVSYLIKADFYYKTDCLLIGDLNVNFYSNPLLVESKVLFYLIPDSINKSVYYFIFDEEDRILKSSNIDFKSIVSGEYNANSFVGKNIEDFRNERCIGYDNEYQYLELGEISLKENYYLDESVVLDVRENGYLKESNLEFYYNRQHRGLQSKYGYGEEGQTVQKNNLIYVKYPIGLLETYGGPYKEKELIRYTKRKLQPGIDLVIEYEYPRSALSFEITEGSVKVNLSWDGPGTYKLYRSKNEFSEELNEDGEAIIAYDKESLNKENLFFIDDTIEADTVYWYSVRVDDYPKSNKFSVRSR
jgi:hypothetical protein